MTDELDHPRVLIIGYNFDRVSGGGITLSNLFKGWPPDRLAVVSSNRCTMDLPPFAHQYILGAAEREWIRPVRFAQLFDQPQTAGPVPPGPITDVQPKGVKLSSANATKAGGRLRPAAKKVFHATVRCLGSDDQLRPLRSSTALISWCASFQPGMLYTQLGGLSMIRLATDLADRLDLPVVVHIMDDWPAVVYRKGLYGHRLRRQMDRELRAIIDRSATRMAISNQMAQEYTERYGHQWSVFHNPVDLSLWLGVRRESWGIGGEFRLVYSGRIGPGIHSSLLDVAHTVEAFVREGRQIRFDIHSLHFDLDPQIRDRFSSIAGIHLHGVIDEADLPATLAAADLLVLPFDFHGEDSAFARLSFPTKAPAYMTSGTPVLIYAPETHAVTKDAAGSGWGYIVSEEDRPALARAILRLAQDEELRETLARRAMQEVERHFEGDSVRRRFAAALLTAASTNQSNAL